MENIKTLANDLRRVMTRMTLPETQWNDHSRARKQEFAITQKIHKICEEQNMWFETQPDTRGLMVKIYKNESTKNGIGIIYCC